MKIFTYLWRSWHQISGAIGLLGGLIDAVLGLLVIIALLAIVIWMFRYAAKSKK